MCPVQTRNAQERLRATLTDVQDVIHETVPDGYWDIPDWERFRSWGMEVALGEHCGNCYEVNFALLHQLKLTHPNVKLVICHLESGIAHCFVVDVSSLDASQNLFWGHSQFMNKHMSLNMYLRNNPLKAYTSYSNPPKPIKLRKTSGKGSFEWKGQDLSIE